MEEDNNIENNESLEEVNQEAPRPQRRGMGYSAGNGMQATGKTMKAAGTGMEAGGKLTKYTGKGISNLGNAAKAIPYVGGVLGGILNGVGKATETLGNVAERSGKAAKKAGDAVDKTGKNVKNATNNVVSTAISDSQDKKFIKWFGIFSSAGCLGLVLIFVIFSSALFLLLDFDSEASDGSGSVGYTYDCSNFTISSTSLSKEEFKTKLNEYASSTGNSTHQLFAQNADNIYDIATSEGINPELVVVRAVSEGFDPGVGYNYWGIGCTNTGGGKDCKSYGSFSEGVKGFIDVISKYSSLNVMMSKYAYIGKFWYNPGGSGLGGCHYASYIYPDGMPERVANACASSKNGTCTTSSTGSCVATTDEDQAAYANWQVKQMANHRKTVFGLEYDDSGCSSNSSSNVSTDVASLMKLSDAEVWNLLTGYSSQSSANSISKSSMDSRVETIEVPIRVWASSDANDYSTKKQMKKITVNKALSGLFLSFFTDLYNEAEEFVINPSECYCYNYRKATNQTRLSAHAFGSACDLNWSNTGNGYKAHVYTKAEWEALSKSKSKYQILYKDSKMAEIMHRYTLSWGGEWRSVTDAMHFSFVGDDTRATLQSKK